MEKDRPISVPFLVLVSVYSRTPIIWSCAGDLWIVSWTLFKFVYMWYTQVQVPRGIRSSKAELQDLLS